MAPRIVVLLALLCALPGSPLSAQGIVIDQGRFTVSRNGRDVGFEEFVIRRAALGRENTVFASGTVTLGSGSSTQTVKALLSALPPEGVADGYQVQVTGPERMEMRLNASGRRYVSRVTSEIGDEDREFTARDTRVLEVDVAHHYYFVRDMRAGRSVHVIEPRARRDLELVAESRGEEPLRIRGVAIDARRIDFVAGEDRRSVWYDGQGRVLRVEIPVRGYVAVRADLAR